MASAGPQNAGSPPSTPPLGRSIPKRRNTALSPRNSLSRSLARSAGFGTSPATAMPAEYYYGDVPRRGSMAVMLDPAAEVFPEEAPTQSPATTSDAPFRAEPAEEDISADQNSEGETKERAPKKSTMPWGQMFVLLCVTLSESVQVQILFPFIYFMVKSWELTDDEKLIGQYVGLIGAAFSLAQFLTSTLWGALSDRIGRKPVLLFGLVGSTFTAVAFGFSQTFWFALAMRAASGFLNGNVGVGKTIMGEITDESNRAQAFNLFGLMWEIGSIIAPILGGLLAEPAKQYPSLFGDFQLFIDYPYALPCMVGALVSGVGAVAGFFFLEETLGRKASKDADEEEGSGLKLKNMDNEPPFLFGMPKLCAYSIIAYGINCFANIIFEEILPLFIASPKSEGGMEFSSGQMGLMMSILGVSALVIQLIFVPVWEKKYGLPNLHIIFLAIAAITSLVTPFLSKIEGPTWLLWGCLILTLLLNIIGWGIAFTAQIVLINDTAPPSRLGTAHGISQTLAAATRTVGPALGGWLYTRGLTDGLPYPLDRTMPYNLCAIVAVIGIVQGFALKRELSLWALDESDETEPLLSDE